MTSRPKRPCLTTPAASGVPGPARGADRRRSRLAAPALAVLALLLSACVTSPTGRSQFIVIPEGQMAELGTAAFQQMRQQQAVSSNTDLNRYVGCITRAISGELPPEEQQAWDVVVFDEPSPNAFALPGGKIGIHTGILDVARTDDQLATVIAHEIAHVIARHGAERVSQQFAAQAALTAAQAYAGTQTEGNGQTVMALLGLGAQVGVLLPFSRTQESEADQYGLELMARAGFDPAASVELWQNMKAAAGGAPPEFLSTHPHPDSRIASLRRQLPEAERIAESARRQGRRPRCG